MFNTSVPIFTKKASCKDTTHEKFMDVIHHIDACRNRAWKTAGTESQLRVLLYISNLFNTKVFVGMQESHTENIFIKYPKDAFKEVHKYPTMHYHYKITDNSLELTQEVKDLMKNTGITLYIHDKSTPVYEAYDQFGFKDEILPELYNLYH